MVQSAPATVSTGKKRFAAFRRPELALFLPALIIGYILYGSHGLALVAICAAPALLIATRQRPSASLLANVPRDGATGLPLRSTLVEQASVMLAEEPSSGKTTACLVLCIDEADMIGARHGHGAMMHVLKSTAERITSMLRDGDVLVRLDGARFAVALAPVRRADLEAVIQVAARMQTATELPLSIDAATVFITSSVGFCLAVRAPAPGGAALLSAAESAADEAQRHGPGAIRSFTVEVAAAIAAMTELQDEVGEALENGQIVPYFQPQLSNDTGAVSGFEALARWLHPTRGLLPPADFLAAIYSAGLNARLGEVILYNAFSALKAWDKAGMKVPAVAVNFSMDELRNPALPDKLKWELDRFELTPERLVIEILESVVADTQNDVIVRNITALARLGCGIDLDDFGTGHASITNIRRFDVDRIKIDRSFVTHVDTDPSQQQMVSAVLSMAERLGLATLAEGVETIGEHNLLAQMGCSHVQGFGIARPMPFEDTIEWMERHRQKLQAAPRLGRRLG